MYIYSIEGHNIVASPGDQGSSKSKKAATTTKTGKLDDRSSKDEKISKVDDKPNKDEKVIKVEDKAIKVEDKSSKVEKTSKVTEIKDEGGGDSKNGSEQKPKSLELSDNPTEKNDEAMVGDDRTDEKKPLDLSSSDPKGEVKKPTKKKIIRKVVKGKTADKKETLAATDETVVNHDDKSEKDVENKLTEQESIVPINVSSAEFKKPRTFDVENKLTEQEGIVPINDSLAELKKPRTFIRKRVVRKVAAGKSSQEEDNNVTEKKPEQDTKNQEEKAKNDKAVTVDATQPTSVAKVAGKKRIIRRVIKKRAVLTDDKPGVALAKDGAQAESNTSVVKTIKEEDLPIVKEKQDPVESSLTENMSEDTKKLAIEKDGASEKKTNEATDNKKVTRTDKVSKTEKPVSSNSVQDPLKHKDSEKDVHNAKEEGSRLDKDKDKRSKNSKEKDAKQDTRRSSKEAKEKVKSDEPPKQPGLFLKTKRAKGSKVY